MRALRWVVLLALALVGAGGVSAQIDRFPIVDPYIDTHVELAGFPTTGSQIEAARSEVAREITREINHVVDSIGELEATAVGREYVEAIDTAVDGNTPLTSAQQYLQTRPSNNPFNDDRPTVPQHDGIDSEIVRQINDAVRDLFKDGNRLPVYQPGESSNPSRTRMEDLMQRYGREVAALQGQLLLDELEQRRLAEAVADGASAAIDASSIDHQNLVKRIIRRYVQLMTPNQELPLAGYWRMPPVEYSRSGACEIYTGDNGGMAPITEEEMPTYPLCGYEPDDALPFLVWQGHEASYIPGTSNIYSPTSTVDIQIARDSNGATVRNVRTTHALEYEVVAPDRIVVRESFIEEGGCSLYAEYVLELASQDETVCNIIELPSELGEDEPNPTVPPGEERQMRVGQPYYQEPTACDASNTPPAFDAVTLRANSDGSLVFDYGTGTQTLYGDGWGYYEFGSGSEFISLNLYDGGQQGTLMWTKRTAAGAPACSSQRAVSLPAALDAADPTPPDTGDLPTDTTDVGEGDDDFGVLLPGEYAVTWFDVPGLCPDALLPLAPQDETVLIGAPSGGAVVQFGDAQYELALLAAGTYMGNATSEAGSIDVSLTTTTPGSASFSWTMVDASGNTCIAMANLTKLD